MNRRVILSSIIMLLLIPVIPGTLANPIPIDLTYDSNWGGGPVPLDEEPAFYLKEERIVADINKEKANVKAFYTFHNPSNSTIDATISLPFREEPDSISIFKEDDEIEYSRDKFHLEEPENDDIHLDDRDLYWRSLPSYTFEISIPPESDVEVEARFTSKVTVYDTSLNDHIIYWFKYLVGTARYWNHSIDRAEFEFRIDRDDFTKTSMESRYWDWERRETKEKVIFEKTYLDWVPEKEYVSVAWEDNRSPIDTIMNNPAYLPIRIGALIFIIILMAIALIIFRKKRKAKKD